MHLKHKQAKNTITFRCVEAPAAPRSKQWHHGKEMILLLDSPASRVTASLITSDEAGQQHLEFLGSVASNGQDPMATPVQDQPRESQCPCNALCMISLHILGHGKTELSSSSGTPGGPEGTLVMLVGSCGWEGSSQQSGWLDRVRGTCSPARGLI